MISKLVLLLTAIHAVCAAVLPAATPTQTADASRATPTLAPRCDDGDCSFGGSATTLQASTVTTTVMSVTSVPCYTTVFVTKGTTTTETVYSTETVTKTETKSGTVYVVMYSPTPVIMSSTYTSVLAITQTLTTFWTTSSGSAGTKTISTDFGPQATTCDSCHKGTGTADAPAAAQPAKTYDAWTHATANGAVQTASGYGWSAGADSNIGVSNGAVVWSAASPIRSKCHYWTMAAGVMFSWILVQAIQPLL